MQDQSATHGDFDAVKSATRAMEIITLLGKHPAGMSFLEIQDHTGWPRSSTFKLLRTLASTEHIEFDASTRRYRIGLRLWEAGQAFTKAMDLGNVAREYLTRVSERLNETAQLAILDGLENVYIAKVEADHHLQLVSKIGSRLPAHATGLGKVLLSGLDSDELDRRLTGRTLQRFTPRTITDPQHLREELRTVRAQGYAVDNGEYTPGVSCVAVAVRDASHRIVAAMSASVPYTRLNGLVHHAMVTVLTDEARNLSRALGWRADHAAAT
jgi:IclR family KDG regulon transcriptional repressor